VSLALLIALTHLLFLGSNVLNPPLFFTAFLIIHH
jgi:hypothetical protein